MFEVVNISRKQIIARVIKRRRKLNTRKADIFCNHANELEGTATRRLRRLRRHLFHFLLLSILAPIVVDCHPTIAYDVLGGENFARY